MNKTVNIPLFAWGDAASEITKEDNACKQVTLLIYWLMQDNFHFSLMKGKKHIFLCIL